MPLASIVKPWVRTASYGARPRVPQLSSKRRLEPAAVLVRAFDIEVGGPALFGPVPALEREDVGAAAVEPDVEDVGRPSRNRRGCGSAEEGGGIVRVQASTPCSPIASTMRALTSLVDQQLAGLPLDEERDRHAPGALAADHPVGPLLDHRAQPVAALLRHEAGVGDRLHGDMAQRAPSLRRRAACVEQRAALILPPLPRRTSGTASRRHRLVHGDEPLRGAAVDDLGLRPPRMRVAMLEVRARGEQPAGLAQVRADRPVGRIELGVDDAALPAEPQPVGAGRSRPHRPRTPDRCRWRGTARNRPRHGRAPCGRGRCPGRW